MKVEQTLVSLEAGLSPRSGASCMNRLPQACARGYPLSPLQAQRRHVSLRGGIHRHEARLRPAATLRRFLRNWPKDVPEPPPAEARASVRASGSVSAFWSHDREGVHMGRRPSERDENRFSGGRRDVTTAEGVQARAASWWGRTPCCAAVDSGSAVRLAIGPQLTKLPHKAARAIFNEVVAGSVWEAKSTRRRRPSLR